MTVQARVWAPKARAVELVLGEERRSMTRTDDGWWADDADLAPGTDYAFAVDRGNPCGKRDYAIILLAARLGLRGIDVKRLELSDFDWPGCRLSVAQAKTGNRIWLPLLKDVARAC